MNIFIASVICCFAVYGLAQLFCRFLHGIGSNLERTGNTYTVMTVCNQEDCIEGMVRAAVWRSLSQNGGRQVQDIVVVDLGSEDETVDILRKLEREYEFVHVMSRDSYINAVREY